MPELISPNGFVVGAGGVVDPKQEYKRYDGDEEITELYRKHVQRKQNTMTWEYRSKVVEAAMRLFGINFQRFITAQLRNPYLHGIAFDFLSDSIAYATSTGHRRLSLSNWSALIETDPDKKPIDVRRKLKAVPSLKGLTTEQLLSLWCSHQGGFEDLLRTLYLMFGRKRSQQ